MTTWYNLEQSLIAELNDRKDEILEHRYPEDLLCEIVDSSIPVYYSQLVELLADNHDLAYVDDQGLIDTKDINVFKIIQTSAYEQLSQIAYGWLEENRTEEDDEVAA